MTSAVRRIWSTFEHFLRVASSSELARARESLALIAARGYHRGRDLVYEMKQLLDAGP